MFEHRISELLKAYRDRLAGYLDDAPPGLRDELVPSLKPGFIFEADLIGLEEQLPVKLPPSFRSFMKGPTVEVGPEWSDITLCGNADINTASGLLLHKEPWDVDLLQFAQGPAGDPVFFDYRNCLSGSEYPVTVIDHNWASPEDWQDPVRIRRWESARWDSFIDLLADVCLDHEIRFRDFGIA